MTDDTHDPDALVPDACEDVAGELGLVGKAVEVERPDEVADCPDDKIEAGVLRAAYRPVEGVTRVLVARSDDVLLDTSNDRVEVLG